jgi:hypothetical protein
MLSMSALQMLADVLGRIFRVLSATFSRIGAGLRWLVRQTYRQRSLGVAVTPHLTGLLDLQAIVVAAGIALLAAFWHVPGSATGWEWVLGGLVTVAVAIGALLRPSRLSIGLTLGLQVVLTVLVALWLEGRWLPMLLIAALAFVVQLILIVTWSGHQAAWSAWGRASVAGLLLGIFTGGAGLIIGFFAPAFPLWVSAVFLAGATIMTVKLPVPSASFSSSAGVVSPTSILPALPPGTAGPDPASGPAPGARQVPQQGTGSPTEGYTTYRPDSLDR